MTQDLEKPGRGRAKVRSPDVEQEVSSLGTVLVTGVADYWGRRATQALEQDERIQRILAIDTEAPGVHFRRAEFLLLDIRDPLIVDLLAHHRVETILHLHFKGMEDGRERMFNSNVLGTRLLLAAVRDAGVKHIVTRSSTFAFGADPGNPQFLDDDRPARAASAHPYVRNLVEMEGDFREFWADTGERPKLTVLRFAPIIGPTCDTLVTRYLKSSILHTVLGFDPLWQFLHEDDVIPALTAAMWVPFDGPINVVSQGVLPLSKVAALLSKSRVPIPSPLLGPLSRSLAFVPGINFSPLPSAHLKHICLADSKRMRNVLGFTPRFTSQQALMSLAESLRNFLIHKSEFVTRHSEFAKRALEEILETDES